MLKKELIEIKKIVKQALFEYEEKKLKEAYRKEQQKSKKEWKESARKERVLKRMKRGRAFNGRTKIMKIGHI